LKRNSPLALQRIVCAMSRLNKLKNSSNAKLALFMVAALFLIWLVQPRLSQWTGPDQNAAALPKADVNQKQAESKQTATPTVPALMPGVDPFKAHIEKNGLAPAPVTNSASNSQNTSAGFMNSPVGNLVTQPGADPFKAFLDKQKQQSKDAGVSPFGK
jgi:hypothetical protein